MIDIDRMFSHLSSVRGDSVVIAAQTMRRPWSQRSTRPELDILYRGCMGKASSLGLGIALGQPERRVVVLDGDASLLMNLGTLVTISDCAPPNFVYFVVDNGVHASTGGHPVPGAGTTDYAGAASALGFTRTFGFEETDPLLASMDSILTATGPTFVAIRVEPDLGPHPIQDGLPKLKESLSRLREHFEFG